MAPDSQPIQTDGYSSEAARERTLSQLQEVSRAMVRIYKEQFGRGPEHAQATTPGPTRSSVSFRTR